MTGKRVTLVLFCAFVLVAAGSAQAAVITVTPVGPTCQGSPGDEPAEWQLTNGWSIVTNKLGVGKITVGGPAYCEAMYQPYVAYELDNAGGAYFPRWEYLLDENEAPIPKQNLGRGAFYASCDMFYGQSNVNDPPGRTPSTVWLGTDTHGGRSLAGIKLKQIQKMSYYTFVSGTPTRLSPGSADSGWESWTWWRNPRHPIQLQLLARNPSYPEDPNRWKQFWYRPWGNDAIIGDDASDGRLSIWEQHNCLTWGRWYLPPYWEPGTAPQPNTYTYAYEYENWETLLAAWDPEDPTQTRYGEYELLPSSYIWKSPGYKGNTDPAGLPIACTGTGKCLNFMVGARFWRIFRPANSWKDPNQSASWWTEAIGFRGHMDYFEFAVNYGTPQNPDIVDVAYNFEPAPDDLGPKLVYLNQSSLSHLNTVDRLIRKRGEPANIYDKQGEHINNPNHDTKEWRIYDTLYKISGKVTERFNAYGVLNDGANLGFPTRVYMIFDQRWMTPSNPMQLGQHWSSWGLLERFRPSGAAPFVTKPFIQWTAKSHNRKLWP